MSGDIGVFKVNSNAEDYNFQEIRQASNSEGRT